MSFYDLRNVINAKLYKNQVATPNKTFYYFGRKKGKVNRRSKSFLLCTSFYAICKAD